MLNKPKSKIQKRLDTTICSALTRCCESQLKNIEGFEWLSHLADYSNFPASLFVTCVFDSEAALAKAEQKGDLARARKCIFSALLRVGVRFKDLDRQIGFDCETLCQRDSSGDWAKRLEANYPFKRR